MEHERPGGESDHWAALAHLLFQRDEHVRRLELLRSRQDDHVAKLRLVTSQQEAHIGNLTALVARLRGSTAYRLGRLLVWPAFVLKRMIRRRAGGLPPAKIAAEIAAEADPALSSAESPAPERRTRPAAAAGGETGPLFSIVVPVHDPPPAVLAEALDSVVAQTYGNWELCLADDASTDPPVRARLEACRQAHPERVRLMRLEEGRGIAGATNAAAALASGEFIGFLDHDDRLAPEALAEVAALIGSDPDADLIYSDEDKLDAGGRHVWPFHKPDFSPELLLATNYLCHFLVIRRSLFEELGGLRPGFDGSQDFDLVLRATESARSVRRIPRILYHWRMMPGSTAADPEAKGGLWRESSRCALRQAVSRRGWTAEVENGLTGGTYRVHFATDPRAPVTIVIPTRDRADLLARCIESIRPCTSRPGVELLVVDNGSQEPETFAFFEQETARSPGFRVLAHDGPFNFSALVNRGVAASQSRYIVLLNNDIEARDDKWLPAMLEYAQQDAIGAVGARLLYPDGRIQHAGIVLGLYGVAENAFKGEPADSDLYFGQARVPRNSSAVTAACLATRREVFERVGGFDERLPQSFGDVDFGLKVGAAGYRIVYTPHAELIHHESASRGRETTVEQRLRFTTEVTRMLAVWGDALTNDPCYNPNLGLFARPFEPCSPVETAAREYFGVRDGR